MSVQTVTPTSKHRLADLEKHLRNIYVKVTIRDPNVYKSVPPPPPEKLKKQTIGTCYDPQF